MFGIQDALTRQTLESIQYTSWTVLFSTWSAYALVGAGIVGIWLMQNAFSAGPLHWSLPTIAAGEPVAGIALGILVFGDRIQISAGELAIEAGGIAALIVGVVAVARSSAFRGLQKITGAIHPGADPAGRIFTPSRAITPPPARHRTASTRPAPGPGSSPARRTGGRFTTRRRAATSAEPGRRPARRRAAGPVPPR